VKKLHRFSLLIFVMVGLLACTSSDDGAVQALLNKRSQVLQDKNIEQYALLIADDYMSRGRNKEKIIDDMQQLFRVFNLIHMETYNRTVRVLPDGYAECGQNYTLKVYADGVWRNITHREQLLLQKKEGMWKIKSGL